MFQLSGFYSMGILSGRTKSTEQPSRTQLHSALLGPDPTMWRAPRFRARCSSHLGEKPVSTLDVDLSPPLSLYLSVYPSIESVCIYVYTYECVCVSLSLSLSIFQPESVCYAKPD